MDRYFAKQSIILFIAALVFLLSACGTKLTTEPTATTPVIAQKVETATPNPTNIATATSSQAVASLTPTSTLPLQAGCPARKPEISPDFEFSNGASDANQKFFKEILDFLNTGGSRQSFIAAYVKKPPYADQRVIQEKDVTADGVPDLLLTEPNNLVAFVCLNGRYQMYRLISETYHNAQPAITKIIDMNQNGVDEIIASSGDMRFRFTDVSEWNGNGFSTLNQDQSCYVLMGDSKVDIRDTDNNGTLELILEQGIPIWSEYTMGPPWRKEIRTCQWDGKAFTPEKIEITDPPHYRFQALQDADRASLQGDYAKALDLYQQTIFNDKLDWWSEERRKYEINLTDHERGYNPTPLPSMSPDPAEYPMQAAYARFRMVLLHVVRGYLSEAQIVYNTLQENFPAGQTGHVQAEMAGAFWLEYQASKNIEKSCAKAIEYATLHPADVLSYLGSGEYNTTTPYGLQSLEYKPEDICPFR